MPTQFPQPVSTQQPKPSGFGAPLQQVGQWWDDFTGRGAANQQANSRLQAFLDYYGGREAPQAGEAHQAAASGFAPNQGNLIRRLEALSSGQGPSLAAQQLKQATDRNMSGAASIAASGRGNAGLAGIQATNAQGQLGAQAAGQSAAARIAEQQMALSQLGGVINQARGSDEGLSQFNALQQNYRDKDNLEAKLRTMGLNDTQIGAILAQMTGMAQGPTGVEAVLAGAQGVLGQGAAIKGSRGY